ncbi:Uncharacterised protein [Mycobacteroides abscessus subsp. abscessus]|nr:Uncharacterised protein [Mycobacteroides abscessus subsp. abscessus]
MHHTDERDVVDLVHHVLQAGDRRLELAGEVRVLLVADVAAGDLIDRPRRVEHLLQGLACQRRPEDHAGAVTAGLGRVEADLIQPPPDLGHVLHPDPVVLHVLAVRDVRGVAGVLSGQLADGAQRLRGQRAAVATHPQHEVVILEHVGVVVTRPGAVVTLLALCVQTPPPEASTQIGLVDAVETLLGVNGFDALAHIERMVVLLDLLVGVERLELAQGPLALTALLLGASGPGLAGCHGAPNEGRHSRGRHTGG